MSNNLEKKAGVQNFGTPSPNPDIDPTLAKSEKMNNLFLFLPNYVQYCDDETFSIYIK